MKNKTISTESGCIPNTHVLSLGDLFAIERRNLVKMTIDSITNT